MAGPREDDPADGSNVFADSPEMLRKADQLAQPADFQDQFDSGKSRSGITDTCRNYTTDST